MSQSLSSRILCWNVRSALNELKLANILLYMIDNNISIACITETWFDSKSSTFTKKIKNAGYEFIQGYREGKKGGGVAVFYKKSVKVKKGNASSNLYDSFEYSYISTVIQKKKIIIIAVYRNQEVNCSTFCSELTNLIDKVSDSCESLMLVGDFNVWGEVLDDPDTKKVYDLLNSYGLSQIVTEPTHKEGHTLDHVYINKYQLPLVSYTVQMDLEDISSDHHPIFVSIPGLSSTSTCKKKVQTRNYKDVNIDEFKTEFTNVCTKILSTNASCFEDKYKQFDEMTKNLVEKFAPLKSRSVMNRVNTPWVDAEFKKNRATRRKLERIWKKSKSTPSKQNYVYITSK